MARALICTVDSHVSVVSELHLFLTSMSRWTSSLAALEAVRRAPLSPTEVLPLYGAL